MPASVRARPCSRSTQHQRTVRCQAAEPAPAAKAAGRDRYRPQSYSELVEDASKSVLAAIEDGINLMEVEFPAVPTNIDGTGTQLEAAGHTLAATGHAC
jgi:hypothetical protein